MNVRLLRSAQEHLDEGARFYEEQDAELGEKFLRSLLDDIGSLARNGGIHPRRFGFYRCGAKRFPFSIYLLDGGEVKVHAVLDGRRDPAWVRRRLRKTE